MRIAKINGIIPYTEKKIEIILSGKDLIVTGKNGCGKTQLLESIFEILSNAHNYRSTFLNIKNNEEHRKKSLQQDIFFATKMFEQQKLHTLDMIYAENKNLMNNNMMLSQLNLNSVEREEIQSEIIAIERRIRTLQNDISPNKLENDLAPINAAYEQEVSHNNESLQQQCSLSEINSAQKTIKHIDINYDNNAVDSEKGVTLSLFFNANRHSSFEQVHNIGSLEQEKLNIKQQIHQGRNSNAGSLLEKFLANWEVKSALRAQKQDDSVSQDLAIWKKQFVESLKVLLDDDSTEIEFNDDTLNYEIIQTGKKRFSFRDLSSGYSAILSVFVELLMQTEVSEYTPQTIAGFVVIDEIDVHLHASLQRKVLPFLSSLFPNAQFIVSTHSPFVLMSVNDAVIFDVEKNAQIDEDLSFYSYSAVLEGILGIKPTSLILDEKFKNLSDVMNATDVNHGSLQELIDSIEPLFDKLNSREKSFYLQGANILADMEEE